MYQKREPGGRNFHFWYPGFQSVVKCHFQSQWAPSQLRASKISFGLSHYKMISRPPETRFNSMLIICVCVFIAVLMT